MDMREKIARALAVADGKDPDLPAWAVSRGGRTYPEGLCWRDQYGSKADAVLDALAEPDEGMIQARIDCYPRELRIKPYDLEVWTTMIDAARKPEGR